MSDASQLADRQCVAIKGGTPPLTTKQIQPLLGQLRGWEVVEGKQIAKSYRFGNFVEAVDFVNKITPVAEAEQHHPDLLVRWGEVRVTLWTHSVGGLTENDFIMAAKIDRVASAK